MDSPTPRRVGAVTWAWTEEAETPEDVLCYVEPMAGDLGRMALRVGQLAMRSTSGRVVRERSPPLREEPSPKRPRPSTHRNEAAHRTSRVVHWRTLIRKLLAGSTWFLNSTVCETKAKKLLGYLLGDDLASHIREPPPAADLQKRFFANLLSSTPPPVSVLPDGSVLGVMTLHTGRHVTSEDAERFIRRERGGYHLRPDFLKLLNGKPWPPCLPHEHTLLSLGCYRLEDSSTENNRNDEYWTALKGTP